MYEYSNLNPKHLNKLKDVEADLIILRGLIVFT